MKKIAKNIFKITTFSIMSLILLTSSASAETDPGSFTIKFTNYQ